MSWYFSFLKSKWARTCRKIVRKIIISHQRQKNTKKKKICVFMQEKRGKTCILYRKRFGKGDFYPFFSPFCLGKAIVHRFFQTEPKGAALGQERCQRPTEAPRCSRFRPNFERKWLGASQDHGSDARPRGAQALRNWEEPANQLLVPFLFPKQARRRKRGRRPQALAAVKKYGGNTL